MVQVVPANLLPQSVQLLRNQFGGVVEKRVVTLAFSRDTQGLTPAQYATQVEELLETLDRARHDRAVCVAAPETLKALMLK